MIKIKYNHPSIPRLPIDINKVYIVDKIKDKYFINIDDGKMEITLFDLKTLFKVVKGSLEDDVKVKVKYINKNHKEEIEIIDDSNKENTKKSI